VKRKLVTERDVQQLAAGARLEVGRDTLVTPAARDAALVRGVALVESATATAPASAPAATERTTAAAPTCCGSCATGGLGDGDYLVTVRDGKAHVRKISP
jgi:hypothetical protein